MTVLSFSSPLLRAVLRLERDCFLSGLPSAGPALRGFTGWGLRRQRGDALREGGGCSTTNTWGHLVCWTETSTWWWLPLHSQGLGAAATSTPQHAFPPPPSLLSPLLAPPPVPSPSYSLRRLPLHRNSRGRPTTFSAPTASLYQGHPSSFPLSSILHPFSKGLTDPPSIPISQAWALPGCGAFRAKTRKDLGKLGRFVVVSKLAASQQQGHRPEKPTQLPALSHAPAALLLTQSHQHMQTAFCLQKFLPFIDSSTPQNRPGQPITSAPAESTYPSALNSLTSLWS